MRTPARHIVLLLVLVPLAAILPPTLSAGPLTPAAAPVARRETFNHQIPLAFEENLGQAQRSVRFLAHTSEGEFQFSSDRVLLPCSSANASVALKILGDGERQLHAEQQTGGIANYYPGKDRTKWIQGIPLNRQLRYAQVVSGVDLVFHGQNGSLEYDLEVAPGADPTAMALQVAGGSFHIEPDGSATIQVDGEESSCRGFHLLTPNAFQESKGSVINARSRFRLDDKGHLRFDVAEYDPHLPLIIDPVVSYSKIIGTNNETEVGAIQIDPAGDVFITGQTFATNYPVAGAGVGPGVGSDQVYLTKLDPSGTKILYSTYLPAPGFSSASSIAVDASGNAYVAGVAGDAGFPTTSANLGTCSTFCNAGFIAKFDDTGALVYSTLIGSGQQLPKDITVDDSGNVYVAGLSADAGLITVNAFQPGYNAGLCTTCGSAFFGKLNPTGTAWIFSSYFYSAGRLNSSTYATAIARDTSGNIYLAGNGDRVPLKGSLQYGMGGSFAAEFGPDGRTLLFSTLLGGTTITEDSLSGLQVAPDGTIYLAGSQIAEDFPYTPNAYRLPTYPIGYAQSKQYIFASAINPQHTNYSWSTFLGQGFVTATSIDQKGNFYVGGTFSTGSVNYKDALASDSTTGAYIIQLDPAGALVNQRA